MNNDNKVTIIESKELSSTDQHDSSRNMTIEAIIGGWLHDKLQKSQSQKTKKVYESTINNFRAYLQSQDKDLIYKNYFFVAEIKDFAQVFCSTRFATSYHKGDLSSAAQANRISVLSSFYRYCIQQGHLQTINPMDRATRPTVEAYANAHPIDANIVTSALDDIDTKTVIGMRDIALLHVLFNTGRRVSEVQGLLRKDVAIHEDGSVSLTFRRTKGGKKRREILHKLAAKTLIRWLQQLYGKRLQEILGEMPIWVDLQHAKREQLKYQGIRAIIGRYFMDGEGNPLGKVHMTRHTFAILALKSGANLVEIQHMLGHKSAATTAIYLETLPDQENKYADKIASMIGIKQEDI